MRMLSKVKLRVTFGLRGLVWRGARRSESDAEMS